MADQNMMESHPRRKSGRHPEKALSAAQVRSISSPGRYFDGHGLFLRVDNSGARYWVQRIVIRGKRTEIGIGAANLVGLAEAREVALANRKLAREGGDPLEARRQAKAIPTFAEAARTVHELHKPSWRNGKHAAQFISTLESYAFPTIGNLKIGEISTSDVLAVLTPIWLKKQETARRVRQRIGIVMKWAVAQGWRQDNPADAIAQALPKQAKSQAHRKALAYTRVAGCIEQVKASRASAATKLAIEFAILTAARSGEVREARWSEVDLGLKTWIIPAARMKAKREHRVPLPSRAMDILRAARQLGDGAGLVFPGSRAGKSLSDMTLSKLIKEIGFDADMHGFRTSFRMWTQEQTSFPREIAEAALAHSIRDKAEAAYARSDVFEKRRELMELWSEFLLIGARRCEGI